MMRWRVGHWPLLAVLAVLLAGCSHREHGEHEILASAPPIVPPVLLMSAPTDGPDHDDTDHSESTTEPATPSGPVSVRATLSHAFYTKLAPEHLILKVDITGTAQSASSRPPLNLALVLDRSGSMADDQKFAYAMEAARLVIKNLSDRDVVSLITFNDSATVLSPAGRAVNPDFLSYRLGQLTPAGKTNLSAGLLEAFSQIDSAKAEGQRRQVIVLTDGMANLGVTDPGELRKLVETARKRGIGLSTLGCGTKFNENVLTDLAEAGGGRYTFVRSAELIPKAIAAELDGLLEVVAQNVKLDIRAVAPAKITRVYGRLIDRPIPSYSFVLGDLRDGEQGTFLLEIAPGSFDSDASCGVDVVLTVDNPKTAARQRQVLHRESSYSRDSKKVRSGENDGVAMYAGVLNAMEQAEEAIQGLDIERFREARKMFDRFNKDAHKYALKTRDQQLLNQTFLLRHFMAELSAAGESNIMHGHHEARRKLKKDADYRRYLLEHHRQKADHKNH